LLADGTVLNFFVEEMKLACIPCSVIFLQGENDEAMTHRQLQYSKEIDLTLCDGASKFLHDFQHVFVCFLASTRMAPIENKLLFSSYTARKWR
jgi:surfactin synthase thioesterase subunit